MELLKLSGWGMVREFKGEGSENISNIVSIYAEREAFHLAQSEKEKFPVTGRFFDSFLLEVVVKLHEGVVRIV